MFVRCGVVIVGLMGFAKLLHSQRRRTSEGSQGTKVKESLVVVVGSTNPCKIKACERAFKACFPSVNAIRLIPVKAKSGVSDQPMTDEETLKGAKNRAKNALQAIRKETKEDSLIDFSVGLEGGLNLGEDGDSLVCHAWMCVLCAKTGKASVARTASFMIPPQVTDLIRNKNMELGEADDVVFKRTNSGQGSGTVGILTHNLIDRCEYYRHALIMALIPYINLDLY
mmetsp:Transcript_29305/g.47039  ORF Transcript_29305/g.47039 Transcript_29305/m.47039 type:complete len:226 (-) Transcript_29305:140-817(-)